MTIILNPLETLDRIADGYSIGRYGDGEIRLCLGMDTTYQESHESLQRRLVQVLRAKAEKFIVGIPVYTPELFANLSPEKQHRWDFHRRRLLAAWEPDNEYGCAFISRPDGLPMDNFEPFYERWEKVWAGRKVAILRNADSPFETRTSVHKLAEIVGVVTCSKVQAWPEYDSLINEMRRFPKDTLLLMCAGPVATIMSYDLHKEGYQAVDCGNLGRLWRKIDGQNI